MIELRYAVAGRVERRLNCLMLYEGVRVIVVSCLSYVELGRVSLAHNL
jgi:hypothetical protein